MNDYRVLQKTLLYDSDEEAEEDPLGPPTKDETFADFRSYAEGVHTIQHFGLPENKLQCNIGYLSHKYQLLATLTYFSVCLASFLCLFH